MKTTDHDLTLKGNNVVKAPVDAARPHSDGCVGCRREGVCIKCGKPALLADGRCISGACVKCCPKIHKHVDGNPLAVTTSG
jgi:hypothetical protein